MSPDTMTNHHPSPAGGPSGPYSFDSGRRHDTQLHCELFAIVQARLPDMDPETQQRCVSIQAHLMLGRLAETRKAEVSNRQRLSNTYQKHKNDRGLMDAALTAWTGAQQALFELAETIERELAKVDTLTWSLGLDRCGMPDVAYDPSQGSRESVSHDNSATSSILDDAAPGAPLPAKNTLPVRSIKIAARPRSPAGEGGGGDDNDAGVDEPLGDASWGSRGRMLPGMTACTTTHKLGRCIKVVHSIYQPANPRRFDVYSVEIVPVSGPISGHWQCHGVEALDTAAIRPSPGTAECQGGSPEGEPAAQTVLSVRQAPRSVTTLAAAVVPDDDVLCTLFDSRREREAAMQVYSRENGSMPQTFRYGIRYCPNLSPPLQEGQESRFYECRAVVISNLAGETSYRQVAAMVRGGRVLRMVLATMRGLRPGATALVSFVDWRAAHAFVSHVGRHDGLARRLGRRVGVSLAGLPSYPLSSALTSALADGATRCLEIRDAPSGTMVLLERDLRAWFRRPQDVVEDMAQTPDGTLRLSFKDVECALRIHHNISHVAWYESARVGLSFARDPCEGPYEELDGYGLV